MKKTIQTALIALLAGIGFAGGARAADEGVQLQPSGIDLTDRASLQRGAKYYMSYCSGCHSLKYQRYSRIGEDLGLSEDEVKNNLMFNQDTQIGDTIRTGMDPKLGEQFFGKAPPDLSVISRVRQPDWVYSYLKSFYLDDSRPLGWNNTVFPNASMPNPLWELQGLQHPEYGMAEDSGERPVTGMVVTQPGKLKPAEFDQVARDITAFLAYTGEPAGLKRQSLGVWVLIFLALFTFMAWLLKREYWKDVH
ncbi:cytochrome c1 [Lysobacter pythonis]|uniref:Cytochrome c1 n=1 Tax=Solilutibacter pythonis TaxID=2483112 RepID=A0A3M2HI53_9GAMM|nr:cytochrome c1 [Lysobacter pythonis]RMH88668.1 cytochrome c1 [Lysobacter pythonis]